MDQNLGRNCALCGVDISHKHSSAVCCSQACNRKRHYQLNKEATLAVNRKWRAGNRERANSIQAAYRARMDGDRRAAYRRNGVASKKAWRQANPEAAREESRRLMQRRRARLRSVPGDVSAKEMETRMALFGGCCAYCGKGGRQTVDHFLALAAGGRHEAANIIPACERCNKSKREEEALQWFQKQPFFSEPRWQELLRHVA